MDQYPYEATCTSLNICIPPWYFNSGIKKLIQDLGDKEIREKIKEEMKNPVPQYDNNYVNAAGFMRFRWSPVRIVKKQKGSRWKNTRSVRTRMRSMLILTC